MICPPDGEKEQRSLRADQYIHCGVSMASVHSSNAHAVMEVRQWDAISAVLRVNSEAQVKGCEKLSAKARLPGDRARVNESFARAISGRVSDFVQEGAGLWFGTARGCGRVAYVRLPPGSSVHPSTRSRRTRAVDLGQCLQTRIRMSRPRRDVGFGAMSCGWSPSRIYVDSATGGGIMGS